MDRNSGLERETTVHFSNHSSCQNKLSELDNKKNISNVCVNWQCRSDKQMLICNDRLTNMGLTSDYVYNFVSDSHFYLRYDNALHDLYSDHIRGVPH